ncbi:serine hydroxymethyltransferase [Rhizobium sp. BK060]|uniref:serine hydroxymethyltransferase n=1 Tax=Rhizobium sp. BK060 TaxID=2587096 RepID=UPI001617614A|nr:serine hydroxymethyltransferase [Rhizobium sp. BK060]MBB3396053.1 glycine hydroxymethyltransferase [Rhizobium sp. BK060]
MTNAPAAHFTTTVRDTDPLIADALEAERSRQQNQIELIASENIISRAVLDAMGHEIANKTLEGYPGNRFHGGGQFVDIAEQAAIDRAKELFKCGYANVQPHSGTQANLAVFFLLLKPGEKVLSLDLAAGGHLSHGMKANLSGRWFEAHNYGVNPQNEVIDFDEMERIADVVRPRLLIAGGSAYPRELDFERMSKIAKKVGAYFLVDMAHIAGLVAGGVHPSPFPHADIVTCTTTKTLRGPRGGLILTNNEEWYKKLQAAVFPGVQGSLHSNVLAAKAICLGEALRDDFKIYARQVVANAKALAETLADRGVRIVSGGTDTHIVLLDLSSKGLLGKQAEDLLARANITSNKNPIPGDSPRPPEWVGMRLGSSAATTRGLKEQEFRVLGTVIADLIDAETQDKTDEIFESAKAKIAELTSRFPVYGH